MGVGGASCMDSSIRVLCLFPVALTSRYIGSPSVIKYFRLVYWYCRLGMSLSEHGTNKRVMN